MRVRTVPPLSEAEFALKKLKRLGCTADRNRMSDLRLDHELDLRLDHELDLKAERSQLLGSRFLGYGRDRPIVLPVHQEHRRTNSFLAHWLDGQEARERNYGPDPPTPRGDSIESNDCALRHTDKNHPV